MPATADVSEQCCPGCLKAYRFHGGAGRKARCGCGAVFLVGSADPFIALATPQTSVRPVVNTPVQTRPAVRFLRVGVAAPFGVGSTVPVNHKGRNCFAAGCFDHYLRRVDAGTADVRLWVDHDPRQELGTTANGDLMVWADTEAVFIALLTPRIVAAVDRYSDRTALSVGAGPTRERPGRDSAGPLMDVLESDLREISLVKWGALPGNGWLTTGRAKS